MKENNGARVELFPGDEELSVWQRCRKKANLQILAARKPYYHNKGDRHDTGFSEDFATGYSVIQAGPGVHCSGVNLQSFLMALQAWFQERPLKEVLSRHDMNELYRHFHAVDESHSLGGTGALLYLAGVWPWLKVDAFVGVRLEKEEQWKRMKPFGVLSFQNGRSWKNGHSTQFVGLLKDFDPEREEGVEGRPTRLLTFEAANRFDNSWVTREQKAGGGFNWWTPVVQRGAWRRTAFYATILNEGWGTDYL